MLLPARRTVQRLSPLATAPMAPKPSRKQLAPRLRTMSYDQGQALLSPTTTTRAPAPASASAGLDPTFGLAESRLGAFNGLHGYQPGAIEPAASLAGSDDPAFATGREGSLGVGGLFGKDRDLSINAYSEGGGTTGSSVENPFESGGSKPTDAPSVTPTSGFAAMSGRDPRKSHGTTAQIDPAKSESSSGANTYSYAESYTETEDSDGNMRSSRIEVHDNGETTTVIVTKYTRTSDGEESGSQKMTETHNATGVIVNEEEAPIEFEEGAEKPATSGSNDSGNAAIPLEDAYTPPTQEEQQAAQQQAQQSLMQPGSGAGAAVRPNDWTRILAAFGTGAASLNALIQPNDNGGASAGTVGTGVVVGPGGLMSPASFGQNPYGAKVKPIAQGPAVGPDQTTPVKRFPVLGGTTTGGWKP